MCGRVNVSDHRGIQALLDHLGLRLEPHRFTPRYNVAPGLPLIGAQWDGGPVLAVYEWGIVPPWAKPGQFARPLINARAETVWERPAFRALVRRYRAVVPVNGFYEWRRLKDRRQPYYVTHARDGALALGALRQVSRDGVPQVCVLTTAANAAMAPIHDRQPVILAPEDQEAWLAGTDRARLEGMMAPCPPEWLRAVPVSPYVNDARHEGPRCIEPVEPPA